MPLLILLGIGFVYKIKNYYIYSNYTFGNVIKPIDEFNLILDEKINCEKHKTLISEYIVEYIVDGELYKDNYYGKHKEGTNIKIYYNKNKPEKFRLNRF